MNKTIAIIVLAIASLATFAAAPPADPCYISWQFKGFGYWQAILVDHGDQLLVTSFCDWATDPTYAELQQWAKQDSAPGVSPMQACFTACIAGCSPPNGGVKKMKYVAGDIDGDPAPYCECECYQPAGPPPATDPAKKESVD